MEWHLPSAGAAAHAGARPARLRCEGVALPGQPLLPRGGLMAHVGLTLHTFWPILYLSPKL